VSATDRRFQQVDVFSPVPLRGNPVAVVLDGEGLSSDEMLEPFEEIPGSAVPGLFDSAGDLTKDAGEALGRVQALLSESTVQDIGASVASLREVLGDLAAMTEGQAEELRSLTTSLNRSAGNVEDITSSEELTRTLASADSAMIRLQRTSAALETATTSLHIILTRMERGEGTLGRLSTSDSLYVSMHGAAESLRLLLDDVRAHPGRYIRLEVF